MRSRQLRCRVNISKLLTFEVIFSWQSFKQIQWIGNCRRGIVDRRAHEDVQIILMLLCLLPPPGSNGHFNVTIYISKVSNTICLSTPFVFSRKTRFSSTVAVSGRKSKARKIPTKLLLCAFWSSAIASSLITSQLFSTILRVTSTIHCGESIWWWILVCSWR
jgi:hypothetical protein